jgi:tetratricopeptide (TPR) repeat protein
MDCLGSMRARSAALRMSMAAMTGIWLNAAGCTLMKQETVPVTEPPPVVSAKSEKDQPRRLPQASTCVAIGDMRMHFASEPNCTPLNRERLLDEGLRAYQQAIKADPACNAAYVGLARLYQRLEEYEKAVATLDAALKIAPKNADLWFELGMCHARHKAWEPALAALRNASELDADNHLYMNMLGFSLARAGRFDESYQYFAKVQGEAKAHYNVARMLHHVQRDAECKQHLALALKAKADFASARQFLADLDNPSGEAVKTVAHEDSIDEAARKLSNAQAKDDNDWE